MRLGDTKIFLEQAKLYKLFYLRRSGLAISSLALIFNVDSSSIRYQLDKYNIIPEVSDIFALERIVSQTMPQENNSWEIINGEKINKGKSYKEYLNV